MGTQRTPAPPATGTRKQRRPSPLLIIGGSVIVLAVVFYVVANIILEGRDPEVSRTLAERKAEREGAAGEAAEGRDAAQVWREDGLLAFRSPEGATRATVRVEIAEDETARTQGLMGRQTMAEDQGMLFIFPNEEYRSFWMANTPLPLDIIYVSAAKEVVTIQRNTVPYSEESVPSTRPATYVVEVNAGFADRHGIAEGDRVEWSRR